MRRRGNKSHKVPNVKLRPPDAQASSRLLRADEIYDEQCLVQDSQSNIASSSSFGVCPRPFSGVILCATGVDKTPLFKKALELGATCFTAFTDKVTHLVASEHGSAKYKCALERKIPILQPSWVDDSYEVWLRGDDVDLQESVEQYRLPIFSDVNLCPSGISDVQRRTQINKLLTQHQGVYTRNLERPVKVTHLLCSGDEETDKMRYAEKFNSRKEAKIHLVWEEWFWDCLEFGGRFDEETYQVRRPRPERKAPPDSPTQASQPPSSVLLSSTSHSFANPKSKPKPNPKSNDDLDEELASIHRPPAVTLKFWESLLKPRGIEMSSQGHMVKSPTKSQPKHPSQPPASPLANASNFADHRSSGVFASGIGSVPLRGKNNTSILHASGFRRANSFVAHGSTSHTGSQRQPFRKANSDGRTSSSLSNRGIVASPLEESPPPDHNETSRAASPGAGPSAEASGSSLGSSIFAGLKFRLLGEARSATVRTAITRAGGILASGSEEDDAMDGGVDYIIVRLVSGSKLYRAEEDEEEKKKYRSECWLERCIFEERVCEPDAHVSFLPLGIEIPVQAAERVYLSFSGLDESEQYFTRRLIRALGINLTANFSRHATHLLCPSATGAKYEKALEWGVPVVNMGWLAEITKSGTIPDVRGFLVGDSMQYAPAPVDKKGKGKLREVDLSQGISMVGITNGEDAEAEVAVSQPSPQLITTKLPPVGLVRQDTALSIPPAPTPSFLPNGLLNGGSGTLSRRSTDTMTYNARVSSQTPLHLLYLNNTASQSSETLSRKPSESEMQDQRGRPDDKDVIPSSQSPSPVKGSPSRSASASRMLSLSPHKAAPPPVPDDVTKALQANITSLLGKGKRRSQEEAEIGPAARGGKRARPLRSKPHSRPTSRQNLNDAPLETRNSGSLNRLDSGEYGGEAQADNGGDPFINDFSEYGVAQESMRVMYEDPGERLARAQLQEALIETPGSASISKNRSSMRVSAGSLKAKGSRKDARLPGF